MKPTNFFPLISIFIFLINSVTFVAAHEKKKEGVDFGYTGLKAPQFWHLLEGSSIDCLNGTRQSPIDLRPGKDKLDRPSKVKFYDANNVEMFNNGNTVEISSGNEEKPLPAYVIDGDSKYELEQFHFHTPSEHRVNGKHFDVEQHLVLGKVNGTESNEIMVVSILYNIGKHESKFMNPIIENIPEKKGESKKIKKVELSGLLKDIKNVTEAFNYGGSLTTPPCTESVVWYVNKNALSISGAQFLKLRSVIGFNSRFVQPRAEDCSKMVKKRHLFKKSFLKSFK